MTSLNYTKKTIKTVLLILLIGVVEASYVKAQNSVPTGAINGKFTINANGDQVYFSQGNLQYQASTSTWRFADKQYDYSGILNNNISSTYKGWIDLFGWGTSGFNHGANCYQPWSTIYNNSDYYAYGSSTYNLNDQTGKADWGYNSISNGGNTANKWRTLSREEWNYVFKLRTTPSGIRYAKAQVNSVNGVIVLPDNWNSNTYSLSNTNTYDASFSSNIISVSQWTTLENAGAAFLPAAGYRFQTTVYDVGSNGYYWSSSYEDLNNDAYLIEINNLYSDYNATLRGTGQSVRLVYPIYSIDVNPNPVGGGTIIGAGTYEEGEICTLTATANAGYTFANWTDNGNMVSTNPTYTFTVNSSRTLVANFQINSYSITVSANSAEGGTIAGAGSYWYGQSCTVTATSNSGYIFNNWTENGNVVSTNPTYTFMVTENRTLVANFTQTGGGGNAFTGAIDGLFSVSADKQVYFSQGNLQYQASTKTWKFAENQYDYVSSDNSNISSSYKGWIDLFGWGTSGWYCGNTYYHPWDSNTLSASKYGPPGQYNLTGSYANADWGVYNPISNGGNQTNQWRTLTKLEWSFVFNTRTTASGIRYAKANVNNVNGVILLPDNWSSSTYSLSSTNTYNASFSSNTLTAAQWSILEQAGAVFLPAAGSRDGTSVEDVGSYGGYWSASYYDSYDAYCVGFGDENLYTNNSYGNYRYYGHSVRLVRVAENYSFGINAVANPEEGGIVEGVGTYEQGAECTLIASAITGYTFANWTENGEVVSTDDTYTFTVTGDRTLVANFNQTGGGGNVPTGAINGLFSVSADQQVYFSQGNLQYRASTNTWKFAKNQYDYVGYDNVNSSSSFSGWIDLFGWGTSGYHDANDTYNQNYHPWSKSTVQYGSNYNKYGYGPSTNMTDPNLTGTSANYDWGVYNPISNGGNQTNQWRTLTRTEWSYVFNTRTTTSGIRYAKANVNNVNGVILLPDNWNSSTYSLSSTNTNDASFSSNTLTASEWSALEQAGAVFLPAAGYRSETSVCFLGSYGWYWSASYYNSYDAYFAYFDDSHLGRNSSSRYLGQSVRLVCSVPAVTTYSMIIPGYGSSTESDHWTFIASPITSDVDPTTIDGLIAGTAEEYDLYRLAPGISSVWENYKAHTEGFVLENGQGYLYANKNDVNIVFIGDVFAGDYKDVNLQTGWNLVGNPYGQSAYINRNYYMMNADGDDVVPVSSSYNTTAIPVCTGVVVQGASNTDVVRFTKTAPSKSVGNGSLQMTLAKAGVRGNETQDMAVVSFDENAQLGKFIFNEDHAKLYIPQNGEDYAIAYSNGQNEMPLYFKTKETGIYTINFENNAELKDAYLFDKFEGAVVNLNDDKSYTFIGSAADRPDRFVIRFKDYNDSESSIFAYQNGNEIIVNGEGNLQVFDVMGRMVAERHINGVESVAKPSQNGVYIFRLNEKNQKIVVR